jgi:hypothetical protein
MGRRLPYRPYLTSWEWVIFRINHEIIIGVSNFDPYLILSNFLNVFCNILIHRMKNILPFFGDDR